MKTSILDWFFWVMIIMWVSYVVWVLVLAPAPTPTIIKYHEGYWTPQQESTQAVVGHTIVEDDTLEIVQTTRHYYRFRHKK